MTVLDAGFLVAVERRDPRVSSLLRATDESRLFVLTVVLGQVWRGGGPRQALLSRFLALPQVEVVPAGEALGRSAGVLLGRSAPSDVVDAAVVALALSMHAPILTSDLDDLRRLDDSVRLVQV